MILAYMLTGQQNDSFMLQGGISHPACPVCGMVINHEWIDPNFDLRGANERDISYTYDGYLIVSDRFLDVAARYGARYVELPSAPGYYSLLVDEVVRFDSLRRNTRFKNLCTECRRFESVAGATPVFLVDSHPLPDRLLRTDVEFGSGDSKSPLILMGLSLANTLRKASLKGVELVPVTVP